MVLRPDERYLSDTLDEAVNIIKRTLQEIRGNTKYQTDGQFDVSKLPTQTDRDNYLGLEKFVREKEPVN